MLARIAIAVLIAVVVYILAGLLLGLVGVGEPWPSILALLSAVVYFLSGRERIV